MTNITLSPNDVISLSLSVSDAEKLSTLYEQLYNTFGWSAGVAPLATLKTEIEQGKLILTKKKEVEVQKAAEEAAKLEAKNNKYQTVMCNVPATATHHDCWILHKPSHRLFYAPKAHHYQLIEYLMNHHADVIDGNWHKSDTAHADIRTGDVKHGMPRTAKENAVTHKALSKALKKAYYESRGQVIPA